MRIYCDRKDLRRIRREKDEYVADYNERKSAYDAQVSEYDSAIEAYNAGIIAELRSQLSNELAALPEVVIEVKDANAIDFNNRSRVPRAAEPEKQYYILFKYDPNKHFGWRSSSLSAIGFNWSMSIYLIIPYGSHVVVKDPVINADLLNADDYDTLKATYDLFKKLDTIDWESLIERVTNEIPKRGSYITLENPGTLDTSKWDDQIVKQELDSYVGKDIWIKANYYKTGNTKYPDRGVYILLTGYGPSKAYYSGYVLRSYGSDWKYGISMDYSNSSSKRTISRSNLNRVFRANDKIRKAGIKVSDPIELLTSEELFTITEE